MKRTPIPIIILLLIALLSMSFIIYISIQASTTLHQQTVVQTPEIAPFSRVDLLQGVNVYREQAGLRPLEMNPLLNQSAQLHANDMVEKQYFEHNNPIGKTPWTWFETVGYNYTRAGENLAKCYKDDNSTLNAWWNSPEHKANILGNFTDTGFGFGQYKSNCVIIVEHFASTNTNPVEEEK